MAKRYGLNGHAGLVARRRSHQTGRFVSLLNAAQGGYDTEGGPWVIVCETHGFIMSLDTLALARNHMAYPLEWCEYCNGSRSRKAEA